MKKKKPRPLITTLWTKKTEYPLNFFLSISFRVMPFKKTIFRSNGERHLARIIYQRQILLGSKWGFHFRDPHLHRCLLRLCIYNLVLFYLVGPQICLSFRCTKPGSFLAYYNTWKDEKKSYKSYKNNGQHSQSLYVTSQKVFCARWPWSLGSLFRFKTESACASLIR